MLAHLPMAHTQCPACGFSPIPQGAEECPSCSEPFTFLQTHKKAKNKFLDPRDVEGTGDITTFGGGIITSAVTAHPYPPSAVFGAGAAVWFLRVSGLLPLPEAPPWTYGLVGLFLLVPVLLIVNLGPVKLLAQLSALAGLAVALYLGRDDWARPLHLLFAAHAVVALMGVTGEPGALRRRVGMGLGLALAVAAGVALLTLSRQPSLTDLGSAQWGARLHLNPGETPLTAEQVGAVLDVPTSGESLAFGNLARGEFGVLYVELLGGRSVATACEALHQALGATRAPKQVGHPPPSSLGAGAVVYELAARMSAIGRVACGRTPDGRLVGLAVVTREGDPARAEVIFDAVGAGLTLQ